MTGYISRLALVHGVYTETLMTEIILPQFGCDYLLDETTNSLSKFWRQQAGRLNGTHAWAERSIAVIQNVTHRTDIHPMTMNLWRNVIPVKGLLKQHRAWCPCCYEEWRRAGQTIYEPLIWALEPVKVCHRHHQFLHTKCQCGKQSAVLTKQARPGYCPHCAQWLGNAIEEDQQMNEPYDAWMHWHIWVATAIGEMLAAAPNLSQTPQRHQITTNITTCIDKAFTGNASDLARAIGISDGIARDWRLDRAIPQFGNLLRLCYLLDIAPLQFMTENITLKTDVQARDVPVGSVSQTRQKPRMFPATDIESVLNAIVERNPFPPRSLSEIARELGYDPSHLPQHFPQQCAQISARFLDYLQQQGCASRQRMYDEVRQVALQIHEEGHYPSLKRVKERVSKLAYALEPEGVAARHDVLKELGLPPRA